MKLEQAGDQILFILGKNNKWITIANTLCVITSKVVIEIKTHWQKRHKE